MTVTQCAITNLVTDATLIANHTVHISERSNQPSHMAYSVIFLSNVYNLQSHRLLTAMSISNSLRLHTYFEVDASKCHFFKKNDKKPCLYSNEVVKFFVSIRE